MSGPEVISGASAQNQSSKSEQIASDLRSAILDGTLQPNDRLPSYSHMTQRYKVAQHTVERAHAILEQEGLVRREQRRGVFVEPRKSNKTGNIGLLLHGTTQNEPGINSLISGIHKQARAHGQNLMLVDANEPVSADNIDGILICCNPLEVIALNLPPTLPRVLLLVPAGVVDVANAVADDFEGGRLATRHLLELGHRHISLMLSAESNSYSIRRLAGYRAALDEYGIEFDSRLCKYINVPPGLHWGEEAMYQWFGAEDALKQWLTEGWREHGSTAVMAHNDIGALAIIKTLGEIGLRVPQDISIVGFDGLELAPQNKITLTTIQVPFPSIGASGTKLLWEQIETGVISSPRHVLSVQLRIGESTRAL